MIRYSGDLGCRYRGIPHDLKALHENDHVKWEVCQICNKKFRWNKGYHGRHSIAYLEAHVRNYAQRGGTTERIYNKIYRPEKLIITI